MVAVYCVYLDNVFLKCFKSERDAEILSNGLQIFLITHDMDMDLVRISKEDWYA